MAKINSKDLEALAMYKDSYWDEDGSFPTIVLRFKNNEDRVHFDEALEKISSIIAEKEKKG